MSVRRLEHAPDSGLAAALARFEAEFTYPLAEGRRFRISHGDDYPRFFRSLGRAACFIDERHDGIGGVISTAVRAAMLPDGSTRRVLYVGDVKVRRDIRGGLTLLALGAAVREWASPQVDAALGVVMGGTHPTPDRYTGRFDIPRFDEIGRVAIFRIPTADAARAGAAAAPTLTGGRSLRSRAEQWCVDDARGVAAFAELSRDACSFDHGDPALRSEQAPSWLVDPSGGACGRLEDTRRAKQLFEDDGREMRSAHLGCFAFREPFSAIELVHAACGLAHARSVPALFVSVPHEHAGTIHSAFTPLGAVMNSAAVFGAGLPSGGRWLISTSEV